MAAFPTTVATNADLYIAVNALSTQLTDNPLTSGATTVNVVSTTGFPTVGFISIDNEIIKYTGTTGTSFTGCTRGADGTSATSHVQNSQVFHNVIAAHHNALKDDLIATEQFISDIIGRTSTQIKGPDGTVSLPGHSFATDPDSGLLRLGANDIALATAGIQALEINSSQQVRVSTAGTAAAPSLTIGSTTNTGIRASGTTAALVSNGSDNLIWDNAAITPKLQVQAIDGTTAAPGLSFANDPDTGLVRNASNSLRISAGNSIAGEFTAVAWSLLNAGTVTFEYDSANGVIGFRKSMLPSASNSFDIGSSTFKLRDLYTVGLVGTTTNDNATAGRVGEQVESQAVNVNAATSATMGDATSISLTAGDWDISVVGGWDRNGATFSSLDLEMGASSNSGNTFAGLSGATNLVGFTPGSTTGTTFTGISLLIPSYRVSLSATTTYYLKFYTATYTAGTPKFNGRISARRVR